MCSGANEENSFFCKAFCFLFGGWEVALEQLVKNCLGVLFCLVGALSSDVFNLFDALLGMDSTNQYFPRKTRQMGRGHTFISTILAATSSPNFTAIDSGNDVMMSRIQLKCLNKRMPLAALNEILWYLGSKSGASI